MNYDITKIKALNFEDKIDSMWWDGNYEPMEKLLEMIDIPFCRDDLLDFGWILNDNFIDNYGINKTITLMKSFIPLDKENLHTDSSQGQTCLNKECPFWHSDREPSCYTMYSDCWADIHIYVYIATKIGGLSALNELRNKWDIDAEVLYQYYNPNEKGLYEKELYEMNLTIEDVIKKHLHQIRKKGDDKMSKPFIKALNDLNKKDTITVFWDENMMYVSDESDNEQAVTSTSLFDAYKFALFINAQIFDYVASDDTVNQFQKELNAYYKDINDADNCIDVWEYLDDIAEDFYKLSGKKINDIDTKRSFVASMSEISEDECGMGFGSATYIAKWLWENIKGGEYYKGIEPSNDKILNDLADMYLCSDEYDIIEFAKALHELAQTKWTQPKDFDKYLIGASRITQKCYYLLGNLIKDNISYKTEFLVGYIDWFGDYEENEKYIYCHIDSDKNEIYFQENREDAPKSAYLHDIAFQHMIFDQNRIQKDIEIKLTEEFIDDIVHDKIDGYDSNLNEWGYIHCHMYSNLIGKFV